MDILIAPDKFKGCLAAPEVARAIAEGVTRAAPGATLRFVPMADGGEGTVEALVEATGGSFRFATVTGPLGDPVVARYGVLGGDTRAAVIEMATASGLALIDRAARDPLRASSFGTGELIRAAMASGHDHLIVGIGGSATNDGGAGMAQALGYRLVDADGVDLPPGGGALGRLDRIIPPPWTWEGGRSVTVRVACDVTNPLCGPTGASAIYGPQKGATPEQVARLDANLAHFARIIARDLSVEVADVPGSGAAGGLGAGLIAFLGGTLEPGVDLIIDAVDLRGRLLGADLCLTGEGSVDGSSAFGKTAVGVARLARGLDCPCVALVGSIEAGARAVLDHGIDAYFSIAPGPIGLDESIGRAAELLADAAEQATRAFLSGRRVRR